MNLLLFFVSSIFSFIFYFFYTRSLWKDVFLNDTFVQSNINSLTGNLFIESFLFLVIWVVLYLSFSSLDSIKDVEGAKKLEFKDMTWFVVNFFKKYLYYIGFFLFYFSIYLILSELWVNFSYFVFIVSFFIFCLFFLANKFHLFRDFIKVNTILFSLVYIFFYVYNFLLGTVSFIEIDFINSFLILIFFVLTIYSDTFLLKKPFSDESLTLYFFTYLFLFVSFYFYIVLGDITFVFSLLWLLFSLFCFYGVPKLELFKNSVIPLRYFSLIFSYIGIVFCLIYLQSHEIRLIMLLILLFSAFFNFEVHRKFNNFVSLSFSFLAFWFFVFLLYFHYLGSVLGADIPLLGYTFFLSLLSIFTPIFYDSRDIIEHYFYHTYSYILNIVGVVYFFVFNWFDIFTFWIILFIESGFVFFSYYKINSLKTK